MAAQPPRAVCPCYTGSPVAVGTPRVQAQQGPSAGCNRKCADQHDGKPPTCFQCQCVAHTRVSVCQECPHLGGSAPAPPRECTRSVTLFQRDGYAHVSHSRWKKKGSTSLRVRAAAPGYRVMRGLGPLSPCDTERVSPDILASRPGVQAGMGRCIWVVYTDCWACL